MRHGKARTLAAIAAASLAAVTGMTAASTAGANPLPAGPLRIDNAVGSVTLGTDGAPLGHPVRSGPRPLMVNRRRDLTWSWTGLGGVTFRPGVPSLYGPTLPSPDGTGAYRLAVDLKAMGAIGLVVSQATGQVTTTGVPLAITADGYFDANDGTERSVHCTIGDAVNPFVAHPTTANPGGQPWSQAGVPVTLTDPAIAIPPAACDGDMPLPANLFGGSAFGVTLSADLNPRCVVPELRGLRLAATRRLLDRAGCALGRVSRNVQRIAPGDKLSWRAPKGAIFYQAPLAQHREYAHGMRVKVTIAR